MIHVTTIHHKNPKILVICNICKEVIPPKIIYYYYCDRDNERIRIRICNKCNIQLDVLLIKANTALKNLRNALTTPNTLKIPKQKTQRLNLRQ